MFYCIVGNTMPADVERKLSAACSTLIIDKPFLGALVLRLPMIAADATWCKTTGTDARALYYNPAYINELSLAQTQFVLAHEALHCALGHFARRQHRVKHRWDLACDFAINPILIRDGLAPPPEVLYLAAFENMCAEEIYPLLDDIENLQSHDLHLYDSPQDQSPSPESRREPSPGGDGASEEGGEQTSAGQSPPSPLSKAEQERMAVQWRQRLAGAAQQALQAGKLSGNLARWVDHLLQPQVPWRMLLAHYMTAMARDDYNYSRPSRREGQAVLPSLRSQQVKLVVVIDTSGSIRPKEMQEFLAEVDAIKSQVRARISLHGCDHQLASDGPWIYEYWEECRLPETLAGGGGTSFKPIFECLDRSGDTPDLLIYFTDAQGVFPQYEPHFPVVWLVKGKSPVPWGRRVQLN